jgi:RNA polymerase sigma factor (sigma-70 family)
MNEVKDAANNPMGLVRFTISKYLPHIFKLSHCEVEECISAGLLGYTKALNKFDTDLGMKFSSYAVPKIKGEILEHLRSQSTFPRVFSIEATKVLTYAYEHTIQETLKKFNIGFFKLSEYSRINCETHSLDEALDVSANTKRYPATSSSCNIYFSRVENEVTQQDLLDYLKLKIKSLSWSKKQKIVINDYLNGIQQKDTAEKLGVSKPYISQILTSIAQILQKNLEREIIDDKIHKKTPQIRKCLKCDKEFISKSFANRFCEKCAHRITAMLQYMGKR